MYVTPLSREMNMLAEEGGAVFEEKVEGSDRGPRDKEAKR